MSSSHDVVGLLGRRRVIRICRTAAIWLVVTGSACKTPTDGGGFTVPQPPGPPWPGTASTVSVARNHVCALTLTGAAYCWGNQPVGAFWGFIPAATYDSLCTPPSAGATQYPCIANVPLPVSGGVTFTDFTVGGGDAASFCGIATGGKADCVDDPYVVYPSDTSRQQGELMCGPVPCVDRPLPLEGNFTVASLGMGFSWRCVLTTTAATECLGGNTYGQLGVLPTTLVSSDTFVQVTTQLTSIGVSQFGDFACGLAASGAAYCWGYNNNGELGNDSESYAPHPQLAHVQGGPFTALSIGYATACGLTAAGYAYCWGQNYGEVGNGRSVFSEPLPTLAGGGAKYVQVSVGLTHTCGLTAAGKAYCWGDDNTGELGDNFPTQSCGAYSHSSCVPVAVAGGLTFRTLSAGNHLTCGITTGNVLYCWGINDGGQVGIGTVTSMEPVPRRVGG